MSAKLAGTSLLESGTEDRPFDGQEFHIFNILETPKNCRALCPIDCFLHDLTRRFPPVTTLDQGGVALTLIKTFFLTNKFFMLIFQYSFFHKVT